MSLGLLCVYIWLFSVNRLGSLFPWNLLFHPLETPHWLLFLCGYQAQARLLILSSWQLSNILKAFPAYQHHQAKRLISAMRKTSGLKQGSQTDLEKNSHSEEPFPTEEPCWQLLPFPIIYSDQVILFFQPSQVKDNHVSCWDFLLMLLVHQEPFSPNSA